MRFWKLAPVALLLPLVGAAAGVSIQFDGGAFQVAGWQATAEPAAGWPSIFTVYSGGGEVWADVPPMIGTYSVDKGTLQFRPRFPLVPGIHYRAVFYVPGAEKVEASFGGIPMPVRIVGPRPEVVSVYPSADVLPMNELKFYIYFSKPMDSGDVWKHVHLIDDTGKIEELAFLEIEPELWDPEHRRLTVLLDPGRIKRGVLPQEEIGSAIVEGKHHALAIDAELQDAEGIPLGRPFRKEFQGGPALRTGIDLKLWKVTEPQAGTAAPMILDFDRPLDYALLQHVIQVTGPSGNIEGNARSANAEKQWRFIPEAPWKPGEYKLVVSTALEDLAGNRIGRPFDVDTVNAPAERITAASVTLPFRIR